MSRLPELMLGPIVGGLNHQQAYLWGRATGSHVLQAWIGKNQDLSDAWLGGQSLPLRGQDGFAGIAPVEGLEPDTQYYYELNFSNEPPFQSQTNIPANGYPGFKTFPAPGDSLSFS